MSSNPGSSTARSPPRGPGCWRQAELMRLELVGRVIECGDRRRHYDVGVPATLLADIQAVSATFSYVWGAIPAVGCLREAAFTTSRFPGTRRYLCPCVSLSATAGHLACALGC